MASLFSKNHISREEALKCVFEGWSDLINEAYNLIEVFNTKEQSIDVSQVKEKFGTLRIYIDNHIKVIKDGTDIVQMVDDSIFRDVLSQMYIIELKSAHICEFCGKEGSVKDRDGWYKCMCPVCFEKKDLKV